MQIVPLNKKVLLKPIKGEKEEKKTGGGILLAESETFEMNKAEVIAIGDKVELKLKKGDIVYYEDIGSNKVGDQIILDESRIVALVR